MTAETDKPQAPLEDLPVIAQDAARGTAADETPKAEGPASEVADFQNAASSMVAPVVDGAAAVLHDDGEQTEDVEDQIVDQKAGRNVRRPRWNGRKPTVGEILTEGILDRALRAHPTLREQLRGSVLVSVNGGAERFLIDWRSERLQASAAGDTTADCTIELQTRDLELIVAGSLNPQIAMLSDKIHVSGNASLAVYFFNLIAPVTTH